MFCAIRRLAGVRAERDPSRKRQRNWLARITRNVAELVQSDAAQPRGLAVQGSRTGKRSLRATLAADALREPDASPVQTAPACRACHPSSGMARGRHEDWRRWPTSSPRVRARATSAPRARRRPPQPGRVAVPSFHLASPNGRGCAPPLTILLANDSQRRGKIPTGAKKSSLACAYTPRPNRMPVG